MIQRIRALPRRPDDRGDEDDEPEDPKKLLPLEEGSVDGAGSPPSAIGTLRYVGLLIKSSRRQRQRD